MTDSAEACARKHRFSDPVAARLVAAQMSKRGGKAGTYKCPACKGWHVCGRFKVR